MAIATGTAIIAGSILSSALAAKSASKSSKAQTKAQEAGIGETRRQFDLTRADLQKAEQTQRDELSPFSTAGVDALDRQRSLLGFGGEEDQEKAFAAFGNSPGQQFLRDRARKNLLRSASSVGGNFGGNVLTALNQQGVDFAAQDFGNEFSRLSDLRRSGQDAATNIGAGAINTAARTGQFGAQASSSISNSRNAQGLSRASGIEGRNDALQSGIEGVFSGASQSGFFNTNRAVTLPAANTNPFARTA